MGAGDGERQVEDGVVVDILPGPPRLARVRLTAGPGCDACGARIICKPDAGDHRDLLARIGDAAHQPGDHVRVVVSGARVIAAGTWAYGLPLVGLCAGTGLGWVVCAGLPGRELWAFVSGLVLMAVPLAVLWFRGRRHPAEEWLDAWVADDSRPVPR
jgi:hypothetical protein